MSLFERIRRFDAYAKTADDFRTQTFVGGVVTLTSVVVVLVLSLAAIADHRLVRWESKVKIDQPQETQKIMVSFDIVFPRLPCFALTLDVMDGEEHMNNIIENIVKTRLDGQGRESGRYDEPVHPRDADYCGSCFSKPDLDDPQHQAVRDEDEKNKKNGVCCNRCTSVFAAYAARKQPMPRLGDVQQCVQEGWAARLKEHTGEGCRARGHFRAEHSAGDFHFAPGESFEAKVGGKSVHVHDLRIFDDLAFDFSHHIRSLRFGDKELAADKSSLAASPFGLSEPLSGARFDATAHTRLVYSYFLKVVPTEFRFLSFRDTIRTYQYSATRHKKVLAATDDSFPSLVVRYDISPMLVVNSQYRRSFTSLITTLTAILGGVYTLAAIFDALFFYAERRLLQKRNMGKAN